jgi:hypothetical protein
MAIANKNFYESDSKLIIEFVNFLMEENWKIVFL